MLQYIYVIMNKDKNSDNERNITGYKLFIIGTP